eukprot:COSAG02_NODE_830_length_16689_cov_10.438999_4_plen_204_part_00
MSPSGTDPRAAPVGMPVAGWAEEAPHNNWPGIRSHLFAFGCAGGLGSRTAPNAAVPPPALLALCAPLGVFMPFLVEPERADSEGPGPFCPRGVPAPSCSCPACSQPQHALHVRCLPGGGASPAYGSLPQPQPDRPRSGLSPRSRDACGSGGGVCGRGVEEARSAPRRTRSSGGISSFATPFSYAPAESEYILLPRTSPQNEGL